MCKNVFNPNVTTFQVSQIMPKVCTSVLFITIGSYTVVLYGNHISVVHRFITNIPQSLCYISTLLLINIYPFISP